MAQELKMDFKKNDPTIRCLQETQFTPRYTHGLLVSGWKRFGIRFVTRELEELAAHQPKSTQRKKPARDKGHRVVIKGSMWQEGITVTNISHALKNRPSKHGKQN